MASINEALSLLASTLFNPKSQSPTVDQRFTQLTWEFQHLYNELDASNKPWTYNSITVNVNSGQQDYLVPVAVGKVLFAYANTLNEPTFGSIGMEIVDLAEVSSDFYLFNPLNYGYSRDFNEIWASPFKPDIALYRQDGQLYFRLRPYNDDLESVTLVFSTGDWITNLSIETSAVLPQYHQLAIVRAGMNLMPGCEWQGDREYNLQQRKQLMPVLAQQADRYYGQFIIAKRQMSADTDTERISALGESW